MKTLYAYQQEGARWLAAKGHALLADEPGLGKTVQALVAARGKRTLVICPASVVDNWTREYADCVGIFDPAMLRPSPTVYSYDKATREKDALCAREWDCLILDEAHYLKNPKAKRTIAIFGPECDGVGGLVEKCRTVFALTGTPAPNNALELWPLMRAVFPESLRTRTGKIITEWSFKTKFCVMKNNGHGSKVVGGKNLEVLRDRLKPFVLRRKKADVLHDLPDIRYTSLVLTSESAAAAMRKAEASEEGEKIRHALESGDPRALEKLAAEVASLRRLIGLAKVPVVIDWVKDWFASGGGKLVLFAHHRDVIEALDVGLRDEIGTYVLHGGTPSHTRQYVIDAFQNNPGIRLFIGQIQAAGVGITLTASSNSVFVESSWVPAENEQAAMRIHRIGQKNACLVRFATLAGSLDEQIQRACRRKMADTRRIFG